MARFGFGQNFGGGGGFGELNAYPAVRAFEITFNTVWTTSQALPAGQRITGAVITVDEGKYGSEVHGAMKRYVDFLVRQGECSATSASEVDRNGPNAARTCLLRTGMTDGAITVLQQAWREWRAGASTRPEPGGGSIDPYAAARMECATSGGTWDTSSNTCTPAGASEGMGAGAWIAIALLGALGAYGVYYVATEKK